MKLVEKILIAVALILTFAMIKNSNNDEIDLYKLAYESEKELRLASQHSLLKFYIGDYCYAPARQIIFKGFNNTFDALYCDKPAILLLINDIPIAVVHNEEH